MTPNVTDFLGITITPFENAGPVGWRHFRVLINYLIDDVNNKIMKEVNIIISKGQHGKIQTSDRS